MALSITFRVLSEHQSRQAHSCVGLQKSSYFYKPRRPSQVALEQRVKKISETPVRDGHRRIHVLLRRERTEGEREARVPAQHRIGLTNQEQKAKAEGLCQAGGHRPPKGPNDVWVMDFLSDQLFDGRKIRFLTIVDAFSKIAPAVDVRQRYTGADVVATLERVTVEHGMPNSICVDNCPEFVSKGLGLWAYINGVILDFSRPGKAYRQQFRGGFQQ